MTSGHTLHHTVASHPSARGLIAAGRLRLAPVQALEALFAFHEPETNRKRLDGMPPGSAPKAASDPGSRARAWGSALRRPLGPPAR